MKSWKVKNRIIALGNANYNILFPNMFVPAKRFENQQHKSIYISKVVEYVYALLHVTSLLRCNIQKQYIAGIAFFSTKRTV